MSTRLAPTSRRALLDSAAYFALLDRNEAIHPIATTILTRLGHERWQLFTTNFILAETHALLLARLGRTVATRFVRDLDAGSTTLIRLDERDERRARAIIFRYTDKDFSFTDAASFAVMERLRIPWAFTFDRNFTQYGFSVLQPP